MIHMPEFKTKVDWKSKLTSRKFWVAVANFVTMLIVAFKGTEETATQVAALIMAGASVVAYIIGEGLADSSPYYIEPSEETDPVEEEQQ
jgi:hypothetical protein